MGISIPLKIAYFQMIPIISVNLFFQKPIHSEDYVDAGILYNILDAVLIFSDKIKKLLVLYSMARISNPISSSYF